MKASQFFISTLKEAPADAEVVSHSSAPGGAD
jgi:prolyl-tRNA synthetase